MMQMDMEIQGLQELDRQLAQLTEATASKVLYGALFDAAKPIWDDARQHAPVAPAPYYRYTKSRRAAAASGWYSPARYVQQCAVSASKSWTCPLWASA